MRIRWVLLMAAGLWPLAAGAADPVVADPAPTATGAAPAADGEPESEAGIVDAAPSDGKDGRDIYQCVLDNRFDSYVQQSRLVSGDRGEAAQESRLRMSWKNWRDSEGAANGRHLLENDRPLHASVRPALLGVSRHQQRRSRRRPVRLPEQPAPHPPHQPAR